MIRANFIIGLELEFDIVLNSTSIKMTFCCISPNHSILPCHDHASYCCIALIVFPLVCRCLFPLNRRGSDDEFDDTDEELLLSSEVLGKQTPLFIPIQSHSLAPALFYCIRTTTIQLLLVAVLEPIPLHDLSLSPNS